MKLKNEKFSLYLSSLSLKDLDEFISTLPEESRILPVVRSEEPNKRKKSKSSIMKKASDADFISKLMSFVALCFDACKAVLSCFLVVFVPHMCAPTSAVNMVHVCPSNPSHYWVVVIWNSITFVLVILLYLFIWLREEFMIEYLDDDPSVSRSFLPLVLPKYPMIHEWFRFYNRLVLITGLSAAGFSIINISISFLSLFGTFLDLSSFGIFMTNILILVSLVYKCLNASYGGISNDYRAISISLVEPVQFNQIDADHQGDFKVMCQWPWYFKIVGLQPDIKQFKNE